MIIDRSGVRPTSSKVEAISQLSQPTTVEDVRVLLGMGGYLRSFIPSFSMVVAPISDLLRDKRFQGKKAHKVKVPWGTSQREAMAKLIEILINPPILALPDWDKPFRLHTDASGSEQGLF